MSSFMRAMLIVLCALWILPELAHAKHVRTTSHAKHVRTTRHYKFNVRVLHFNIMIFFICDKRDAFNFCDINLHLHNVIFINILFSRSKCKMSQDFAKQRAL